MAWETTDKRNLPPGWDSLRRRRFEMDGWQCTARNRDGSRCKELPTDCDHTGDRDDHRIEMLTSLCRRHHARKTGRQGRSARKRAEDKRDALFRRTERHPGAL